MALTEGYLSTPDGIRLFFQKIGTGPDIVIIPNATYMFDDFSYLGEHRTVVFYDLRNRGRSDAVTDEAKLKRGIHNDVDDLEAVRQYFGAASVTVLGHSYLGFVVVLYAMQYPRHVTRVIQIGPGQPVPGKEYPPNLRGADAILVETNSKLMELQKEGPSANPEEFGRRMWSLIKPLYVASPDDVGKIRWSVEHLANESFMRLMTYYATYLLPSIQSTSFTADDFARVKMPVLTIHGTRDRQAAYGGARDWASMLPNARLITIEGAAHLPWIESPQSVFDAIHTFLDGKWPEHAEQIDHAGAV